jgi:putative flippase GtrA
VSSDSPDTACLPQEEPVSFRQRLLRHFPAGQFSRYIAVGVFNTIFGYCTYVLFFTFFSAVISANHPSLLAPLASVVATPLNITVAYFGYKIFVFKTRGNYLAELLKCFGVYGVSMLPGLLALSALTRLIQAFLNHHDHNLLLVFAGIESHFSGRPQAFIAHIAQASVLAGYIAGALVQGSVVIFSFFGHKKVTFAQKSPAQ